MYKTILSAVIAWQYLENSIFFSASPVVRKMQLRAVKISAFLAVGSMTNDADYLTRPESCRKAADKKFFASFLVAAISAAATAVCRCLKV